MGVFFNKSMVLSFLVGIGYSSGRDTNYNFTQTTNKVINNLLQSLKKSKSVQSLVGHIKYLPTNLETANLTVNYINLTL